MSRDLSQQALSLRSGQEGSRFPHQGTGGRCSARKQLKRRIGSVTVLVTTRPCIFGEPRGPCAIPACMLSVDIYQAQRGVLRMLERR